MTSTASIRLMSVFVLCGFFVLKMTAFGADRIAQVKYFNTENGMLKHNSVETVVRDSMGYIWVGTNFGLNRLDGYRTLNYIHHPNDSTSISDNHVKDLFVDSAGRLWIGTIGGGLNRFDYTNNTFVSYPLIQSKSGLGLNVSAIAEDHDGFLWVGIVGEGLCRLDTETGDVNFYEISKFHPDFQRSSNISNLLCDRQGNIWVGFDFDQNGIYKLNPHTDQITFHGLTADTDDYLEVGPVMGIDEMDDGTLLFTIWNGKLYKLNPNVDQHIQQVYGPDFFNNTTLTSIAIDQDQNIWIGTWDQGLFLLAPDFSLIENYKRDPNDPNTLISDAINDLYLDQNQLWVSTREQGLNLLSLQPRMFQQINPSKISGFREIDAHRMVSDGKGTIWIGARGQGLWKYQIQSGRLKHYSKEKYPELINENILSLHLDQSGLIWMGTDGSFIGLFDPVNEKFQFIPHYEGVWNSVYSLAETDSFIWCGTWGTGIKKLDKHTLTYTSIHFDTLNQYNNTIFDIERVGNDLWLSSFGLGLIRYHLPDGSIHIMNKDPRYTDLFPKELINDLYVDGENTLWLSTSGGGLAHFDPRSGNIMRFDQSKGLSSNVIQAFIIDSLQNKWISTNDGITLVSKNDEQTYTFYTHNGLQMNHLNMASLLYDAHSGLIFAGSPKGVSYCMPGELTINQLASKVIITGLTVDGKDIKPGDNKILDCSIDKASVIWLDHGHNLFTLHFSSMEFTPSFKSNYYYKLAGFNDEWTKVPHDQNSVQYTNLDPGTYYFSVKATNNDGVFFMPETTVRIEIKPAFRQTIAFKILMLILLLMLVGLIYYLRYQSLISNQIKLERLVKERTAEINRQKEHIEVQKKELELANQTKDRFFSIIGHDLKNPISIIDQFNELLLLDHEDLPKDTILKYYEILKKTSGQTIKLLDDLIIWARTQNKHFKMDKQQMPVDLLFRNNYTQCETLAQNKKITLRHVSNKPLFVMADEQSIQTVLRNLTINALKFSTGNSVITITANEEDRWVKICVNDEGIGMPPAIRDNLFRMDNPVSRQGTAGEQGTGLGLIICKEFVNLNGGQITVESEEGKGTQICFTLEKG